MLANIDEHFLFLCSPFILIGFESGHKNARAPMDTNSSYSRQDVD